MLRLVQLEELDSILGQVPALIEKHEKSDTDFSKEVKRWFKEIERALYCSRLPLLSNIASLRGEIVSAEKGNPPSDMAISGKKTKRKIVDATSAVALQRANSLINERLDRERGRFGEAELLMRSALSLASYIGIINNFNRSNNTTLRKLLEILRSMRMNPEWPDDYRAMFGCETLTTIATEIGRGTAQVIGLVGHKDALILLERCISEIG
ncbi:MAG TPA: hypothetical protein VN285_13325 [Candidatus Deferrimicrobium sp.]|nr:hypothetical protein [Candidatus Deferrimicrobium sp.]